jgi:hypothetical protein
MSAVNGTLQIEITIAPAKGRKGGRHLSPAVPKVLDPPRIPRITRLMALAIKFQEMIDRGEVRDYADLARLGYVTRARITQIMNLLHLAPAYQWRGVLCERYTRQVSMVIEWSEQRWVWEKCRAKSSVSPRQGHQESPSD